MREKNWLFPPLLMHFVSNTLCSCLQHTHSSRWRVAGSTHSVLLAMNVILVKECKESNSPLQKFTYLLDGSFFWNNYDVIRKERTFTNYSTVGKRAKRMPDTTVETTKKLYTFRAPYIEIPKLGFYLCCDWFYSIKCHSVPLLLVWSPLMRRHISNHLLWSVIQSLCGWKTVSARSHWHSTCAKVCKLDNI